MNTIKRKKTIKMISGMKDKLWIYCYKRMGLYKLFKYMREHKNGGKNKTYIK